MRSCRNPSLRPGSTRRSKANSANRCRTRISRPEIQASTFEWGLFRFVAVSDAASDCVATSRPLAAVGRSATLLSSKNEIAITAVTNDIAAQTNCRGPASIMKDTTIAQTLMINAAKQKKRTNTPGRQNRREFDSKAYDVRGKTLSLKMLKSISEKCGVPGSVLNRLLAGIRRRADQLMLQQLMRLPIGWRRKKHP